ncbi:MAG: hypothetical protein GX183_02175 [Firmicutes bacterium]|nr:hypothetical protein [Bacillota bacterium]
MPKINLLPEKRKAARKRGASGTLVAIVLLELLLVMASAVYSHRHFTIISLQAETAQVKQQVASLKPDLDMIDSVQVRTKEIESILQEVDSLAAAGHRLVPVLREIRTIIPGDVWFTGFRVDDKGAVSISGGAFAMESVARTARQLVHSALFDSVKVGAVTLVASGDQDYYTFTMSCTVQVGR